MYLSGSFPSAKAPSPPPLPGSSDDPKIVAEARQFLLDRADNILDMIEDLDDGWLETEATEDEIEKVRQVADMIKQHRAKVGV